MNVKQILLEKCSDFVNSRKAHLDKQMDAIKDALQQESKSTAGDKHETGRAILQLEREKVGNQFIEVEQMLSVLSKIRVEKTNQHVHLGSLVRTSLANYFIAISAGEIVIDKTKYYAISAQTPIAKLLMSKQIGDTVSFRNQTIKISKIE